MVAKTPEEAAAVAKELGGRSVVKAQVHAGGRGKAGGIKIVSTPDEAATAAKELIGTKLVTFQTGPEGVPIRSVLVEEALEVDRELYVGMVIDGAAQGVVVMVSEAGGMDIEEVAEETPERIIRIPIDPVLGLIPYQGRKVAYGLNMTADQIRPVSSMMSKLYDVFLDNDCSLVEINPLVVTKDGRVLAADAKLNIDDDAMFRHRNLQELHDPEQEDELEAEAGKYGISYVKLDGDVGCMVNGAGLAMATMDVTFAAGTMPANFLDVGGGADEEKVAQALKIILSDHNVSKVLINIFGGILRCDVVARGALMAAEAANVKMPPMVVRMLGTNAEEGRKLLEESDLNVTLVGDLGQAAQAIKALG
jgi:succinyl-CoA synthetase beta subunit